MTRDERKRLRLDLEDWGYWSRKGINELSLPSMSIEARMAARTSLQRFTGHWALYEPHPRERRLDAIIQSLSDLYKRIIILRYKEQANYIDSCHVLNMKKNKYYSELEKAEHNVYLMLTRKRRLNIL